MKLDLGDCSKLKVLLGEIPDRFWSTAGGDPGTAVLEVVAECLTGICLFVAKAGVAGIRISRSSNLDVDLDLKQNSNQVNSVVHSYEQSAES